MDNLSVHKAKIVKEVFDDRFRHLYLPMYSSPMNPIEHLWSIIKGRWRKLSHLVVPDSPEKLEKMEQPLSLIKSIVDGLKREKVISIANSNCKMMARSLRGHLV
jgi:transposase